MGIPDEVVAARIEANADAVDFDIWPENWDTVEASSSARSGAPKALAAVWAGPRLLGRPDYAAAAGLDKAGLPNPPDVWRGIRVMEAAAKNCLNGIEDTD
jgi:hypothetical protein